MKPLSEVLSSCPILHNTDSPERSPSPDFSLGDDKQKSDLFGNEELFGGDLPNLGANSVIRQRNDTSDKSSPDDLFQGKNLDFKKTKTENLDDLFNNAGASSKSVQKSTILNDEEEDLFSSLPKSSANKTKGKSSSVAEDSGIFGSAPKKVVNEKTEGTKKPVITNDDDDDNIFAVKKTKAKPKPSPIIDDDDDLFSSPSLSKPKDKKNDNPPAEKSAPAVDDDDDIFAEATKVEKKKPKKVVTKDEDIFTDGTDIFSDLPQAKPKEKKPKKKASAAAKKTVFKDDIGNFIVIIKYSSRELLIRIILLEFHYE